MIKCNKEKDKIVVTIKKHYATYGKNDIVATMIKPKKCIL